MPNRIITPKGECRVEREEFLPASQVAFQTSYVCTRRDMQTQPHFQRVIFENARIIFKILRKLPKEQKNFHPYCAVTYSMVSMKLSCDVSFYLSQFSKRLIVIVFDSVYLCLLERTQFVLLNLQCEKLRRNIKLWENWEERRRNRGTNNKSSFAGFIRFNNASVYLASLYTVY